MRIANDNTFIEAELHDFTTGETRAVPFPLPPDLVMHAKQSGHEVMLTALAGQSIGDVGLNLDEEHEFEKALRYARIDAQDLKSLLNTYLLNEIVDHIRSGGGYTILDVGDLFIHDEDAVGRLLYEEGYARFPAEVPEDLEDYMDYAALWRDAEINLDIRRVGNALIFEESGVNPPMQDMEQQNERQV